VNPVPAGLTDPIVYECLHPAEQIPAVIIVASGGDY
jgi:hypothetical protein